MKDSKIGALTIQSGRWKAPTCQTYRGNANHFIEAKLPTCSRTTCSAASKDQATFRMCAQPFAS
jgi:hypothetical protein